MTELASQESIRVSAWPTIPYGSITPEYSGYLRVPKNYNQIGAVAGDRFCVDINKYWF